LPEISLSVTFTSQRSQPGFPGRHFSPPSFLAHRNGAAIHAV
jgi:hypothetical protein